MRILQAEFVVSNSNPNQCPADVIPEYAFIGRSNVGKSSLINCLTNHKSLAKTSGRPGKTQLINHFKINNQWHLVDLPGYGYARVSKSAKAEFQKLITRYFEEREQLVCAFVLIDIRLEPQKIDLEFLTYLGETGIPFCILFTKADKLGKNQAQASVAHYRKVLLQGVWAEMPPYFITSAEDGTGREAVLDYIDQINQAYNAARH